MNDTAETPKEEKKAGRPEGSGFTDEQYKVWLEDMRPHLVYGCSLYRAMEKAGLLQHKDAIYEKYRQNDYFSEKVDGWRSTPGENANEVMVREVERILTKTKQEKPLTNEEVRLMTTFVERHRTAQPFFVNRTETGQSKDEDLGKIIDILESDYGEFNEETSISDASAEAEKQEVAHDAPIQSQGQEGPISNIPSEPNPTQTS